jgi:hypothetical protein
MNEKPPRTHSGISNRDIELTMEQANGDRITAAKMLGLTRDKLTRRINACPALKEKWVKPRGEEPQQAQPLDGSDEVMKDDAIEVGEKPKGVSPAMIDAILKNAGLSDKEAELTQHFSKMHAMGYSAEMLKVLESGSHVLGIKIFSEIHEIQERIKKSVTENQWLHSPSEKGSTMDEEKMLYETMVNLADQGRKLLESSQNYAVKMLELKLKADGEKGVKKGKPGFAALSIPK